MIKRIATTALPLLLFFGGPVLAQDDTTPRSKPVKKAAFDKPFLWKVEGAGKTPSFLFGTIHLPDRKVLNLPKVVSKALEISDAFYGELAFDANLQSEAMKYVLLRGKTLKDVLKPKTYERLAKYLGTKGIQIGQVQSYKPWFINSLLGIQLSYRNELMQGLKPLDQALYTKATKAGKETGGLETLGEQVKALESMDASWFLDNSLDGLEKADKAGKRSTDDLLAVYLQGSLAELVKYQEKDLKKGGANAKKFVKVLIDDRNSTMTDRIVAKLKKHPNKSYFFAIGALHYPGDKGIVALLKAKGYTVTRLTAKDAKTLKKTKPTSKPAEAGKGF